MRLQRVSHVRVGTRRSLSGFGGSFFFLVGEPVTGKEHQKISSSKVRLFFLKEAWVLPLSCCVSLGRSFTLWAVDPTQPLAIDGNGPDGLGAPLAPAFYFSL